MEKMLNGKLEKSLMVGPDISWPKEFPELKLIDDMLRCGICYDYIKTCMVTPCAHSYCSICIRRSLHYKTACPTCFEETFETNLRNNRNLDRITELFQSIKDKLIKHLRIAAVHFNCNENLKSPAPSVHLISQKATQQDETPNKNVPKLGKLSTKGKLTFKSPSVENSNKKSQIAKRLEGLLGTPENSSKKKELESLELSSNEDEFQRIATVPPMFLQPKVECQPKNDIPSVPCPVCGVNIPERNINAHLDNCLASVNTSPIKSPVKARQKRNPLPKMVWSLMAEKELRKKLKDYGLNTQGEKKTLISRIQRYILLYNSECDSDNPRPISEIIRQVEREEKPAPSNSNSIQQRLVINKKTDPKIIEEENKKYIQENKDSFKKLIEVMREREGRNIRPTKRMSNVIISDDEDEDRPKDRSGVSTVTSDKSHPSSSTTRNPWENIDLVDSDTNDGCGSSSSPILGGLVSDRALCNSTTSAHSRDSTSPANIGSRRICDRDTPELEIGAGSQGNYPEVDQNSFSSPPKQRSNYIITTHSDSDDSISLLVDQNIDEDILNNALGPATENVQEGNSLLEDPDFVVDTEDQNDNYSEEVFLPKRKSKRKLKSPVLGECNPSPRRTRRRTTK